MSATPRRPGLDGPPPLTVAGIAATVSPGYLEAANGTNPGRGHQTAEPSEFVAAVKRVDADTDSEFVLLVPATPVKHLVSWTDGESRAIALQRADSARETLRASGVRAVDAVVGHADPYQAIA